MLSPVDIQNKKFSRSFRGYSDEEVDSFLDDIIDDYEQVYKENVELKDKVTNLNEKLGDYKNWEDTLKNILITAQQTSDEIKNNAKVKSEMIIKEANEKAEKIINESNNRVLKINEEYEQTKQEMDVFKAKIRTMFLAQADMLKNTEDPPKDE